MSAQGAEFVRSGGERLPLWQKTTEDGTKRQAQSLPLSVESWKRAGIRALASARSQCYSGWRSVQQGADHRKFLQGYGNANVGKSGGASAEHGHGERYHYRLCKRARSQLIKEGNFMAARALDFLFVEPSMNLTCLRMDLFPANFSVFVATREHWPPGSMNCGNVLGTD